jgi:hypothetical protein
VAVEAFQKHLGHPSGRFDECGEHGHRLRQLPE